MFVVFIENKSFVDYENEHKKANLSQSLVYSYTDWHAKLYANINVLSHTLCLHTSMSGSRSICFCFALFLYCLPLVLAYWLFVCSCSVLCFAHQSARSWMEILYFKYRWLWRWFRCITLSYSPMYFIVCACISYPDQDNRSHLMRCANSSVRPSILTAT